LIAEGLFMYFQEAQVRALLARLAERFPGAELVFETMSPQMLRVANWKAILGISADFEWGLWSGRELEGWLPGLRWIENWCYFDYHPERWGLVSALSFVPFLRSLMRIEHVKLPEQT
jgi:O-methyltransferase involved in polyketide biosynthesis